MFLHISKKLFNVLIVILIVNHQVDRATFLCNDSSHLFPSCQPIPRTLLCLPLVWIIPLWTITAPALWPLRPLCRPSRLPFTRLWVFSLLVVIESDWFMHDRVDEIAFSLKISTAVGGSLELSKLYLMWLFYGLHWI